MNCNSVNNFWPDKPEVEQIDKVQNEVATEVSSNNFGTRLAHERLTGRNQTTVANVAKRNALLHYMLYYLAKKCM